MDIVCAPLLLRSNYSLLTGTASIERLVRRAEKMGLPALALTDRNNLYGAVPFYKRAREAGIRPIIGAEVTWNSGRVVLLARNRAGYSNLCRILTRRNLRNDFSFAGCLPEFQEGLHVLIENPDLAERLAPRLDTRFLWLLLTHPCHSGEKRRRVCQKADQLDLHVAATPDVYFLEKGEYAVHRTLSAIRENSLLSRLDPEQTAHPDSYFPPADVVAHAFRGFREALENSRQILDDCNLELTLGEPIFPNYSLPEGETASSYLRKLCRRGLGERYNPVTPDARRRLEHELRVIEKLGFTEYFIVVRDILSYAREHGIATIGRGSGASSIVSYVLGITQADPMEYDIPFERFLHMEREDCPDLDVDLCWIKRDELIESIYRRYGDSHVAMVSTHNTFRLRSAFREVAKCHGITNDAVNKASRRLTHGSAGSVRRALAGSGADLGLSCGEKTLDRIAEIAEAIRGAPRHLGIHCGGLVIGDRPVDSYVPLERATKGIVVTQYEKDAIEEIGLVKMDFLGNHGVTIRDETLDRVEQRTGGGTRTDNIPPDDTETAEVLAKARTLSCCQLESPAMRNLLRMLRASSVKEVMKALALIRPAPASNGMKEEFVRRARGLDEPEYPHPLLQKVLQDTYGIMLYEDDAMQVASTLAGVSLEKGDLLRKAISKVKSPQRMADLSRYFVSRAVRNGITREVAADMWSQMAQFNAYSFCKAHAASYAILAYQLAYLKAHHPLEFMVSVLNHHWGMYPRRVHLEEARRLGLGVLPPSINRSRRGFAIDEGKIRVGLNQVRQLSDRAIERIIESRQRSQFRSVMDFLQRVKLSEAEAENLILSGAFDFTGRNRPKLMWGLKTAYPAMKKSSGKGNLLSTGPGHLNPPALKDYDLGQKLAYELSVLELTVSEHPMRLMRPLLQRKGFVKSTDLEGLTGEQVRTAGVLAAFRRTPTRNDETMQFFTLEDECGIFEVTLFPRECRRFGRQIEGYGPYAVEGKVEDQYGALSVTARKVARLGPGLSC